MKNFKKIYILAIVMILCGCGSNYKPPVPAPLTDFQPTLQVQKVWASGYTSGTKGRNLKLTPVVDNGKIFVDGYNGDVVAIDLQSGRKIWAINTKLNLTSGLTAGSGMLFAGSEDGKLVAIQQQNGIISWSNALNGAVIATPTIAGDTLLVKVKNGDLSAFNIDIGKFLWTYNNEIPSLVLSGDSSAAVADSVVVAGFPSGELAAVDLNSGRLLWQEVVAEPHGSFAVERMVDIDADPQIVNGVIYVVTYQGRLAAIDLKTGRVLWSNEMSSVSGLAVDEQKVYVSDFQGYVWCLDRKTGTVIWKQEALLNHGVTAPAMLGGVLVVADAQGYVHFIAKNDGHFVSRINLKEGSITATPLVIDNAVYVYTQTGELVKLTIK
jgi:outer membrane protein assembly factor BamB